MKKRILVIEDEEVIADVLKDNLEILGYDVTIANSGMEGIRRARGMRPDVITLDILMPKLDGLQVLNVLKSDEITKDIPVIIISVESGAKSMAEKKTGLKLGALAFLKKPVDFGQLNQKIKSLTQKKTVLVVEDSPVFLELIQERLRPMGYNLICVRDGEEALKKAKEFRPDVILMDVLLPQKDGFEVTKRLKADKEISNIPVIAYSGYFNDIDDAQVVGIDKFLAKEFSAEDLAKEVSVFLEKAEKIDKEKKKVLIVDDRANDRLILKNALEVQNFEVSEVGDGLNALEIIKKKKFDICLVDFRMPGMNGLEVIDKIREIDSGVLLILISGFALEEDERNEIKNREGISFIRKPYDVTQLLKIMSSMDAK